MKKFNGNRPTQEIIDACKANKWEVRTDRYNSGEDHISFEFIHGKNCAWVVYNTFNGRFFGKLNGKTNFDSSETKFDNKPWFSALLDFVYLPMKEAA